jgi:hypothetical protein
LVILNGFGNRKKRKKLTCYSVYWRRSKS